VAHYERWAKKEFPMSVFGWLEQTLFTGEVIQDFGPIYKTGTAAVGETHTLLLCRKRGKEWITIRHSHRAGLGFSVTYTTIPAELAEALAKKFVEIAALRDSAKFR
jgi:hypothetical protein